MRILFISNLYPPHALGGWEQNCQEVVEALSTRGHECRVLTSRFGIQNELQTKAGITRALHLEANIHHYQPLDFFLKRPRRRQVNRIALQQAINGFHPDVIFIWGLWNLSREIAYWAEQWLPDRVAYAVAGYWLIDPTVHEIYWHKTAQHLMTRIAMAPARWLALRKVKAERSEHLLKLKHVFCVSDYVRKKMQDAGALPYGARIIRNGIDPAPFLQAASRRKPDSRMLRLIYAGGVLPHKGIHTAIEALGILKKRGELNGLHMDIVGRGHPSYLAALKKRIKDLDILPYISFAGRVPRSAIPAILALHDVFLFTSTWEEPIARSVMEAMAAELAVIGTAVGGQAEMLEDEGNALIYPANDAEALAASILHLQHAPRLRARLAAAGRQTVLERFTLPRMVDEIETWLLRIVS